MTTPRQVKQLRVTAHMRDGTTHEALTINNHAYVAWDFTRNAKGWPDHESARMLWMTFLLWQQMVDDGLYPAKDDVDPKRDSFRRFRESDLVELEPIVDEEDTVDPTPAESGSA